MSQPAGIRAHDLEMLPRAADRAAPDNHGWVFGLPPGITPAQWPLDPISGYPLMHGFTLRLPEDHRVHGPEIVALSFFATAADHNDGGARRRPDLHAAVTGAAQQPSDPELAPFAAQARSGHARLHRMDDILGYAYAVILLTQAEFDGALCQPPEFGANRHLDAKQRPRWLATGSGYAMFSDNGGFGLGDLPVEEVYSYKLLGAVPDQRLDWHRAIGCTPRANDPNAGLAVEETFGDAPASTGYVPPWYYEGGMPSAETYREHAWAKDHKPNHIGGTMRPIQAPPAFSPHYIGFEETFGGYNFGGGNAQLDFLEMKFDWACG